MKNGNQNINTATLYRNREKDRKKQFHKLKKLLPELEKLSFSDILNIWEKNFDPFFGGIEGIFILKPSNEYEQEQYNKYLSKHWKNLFPDKENYDVEIFKKKFFEDFESSKNQKGKIESEIEKVESKISLLKNKRLYGSVYKNLIYDYEMNGKEPEWKKIDFETVKKFAEVKYLIECKLFLTDQLIELKTENNFDLKKDFEILETRTKIILLHKLGFIEHLKKNAVFKTESELAKFLCEIIESDETKKKKTFHTVRTDLRYIDIPKHEKYPLTPQQKNKVNSILSKYGFDVIN